MVGTNVTYEPDDLHPASAAAAAKIGAGLFRRPRNGVVGNTDQTSVNRKQFAFSGRIGSQPSTKGPSEWFAGTVRIDPLFQAPAPALVQGASVTFEPGARTATADGN